MARFSRRTRAVIDATLMERFERLAGAALSRFPEVAYPLVSKLTSAKQVPPARMPADVVTIGSRLSYRVDLTGRTQQVLLAWPEEADISHGKISVLTPIGVALLGLSAGDQFSCKTRAGEERAMTVLEVETEQVTKMKV
ncbi:nucleoside diphosphate kinase regulator [Roseinatronobacter sp.]